MHFWRIMAPDSMGARACWSRKGVTKVYTSSQRQCKFIRNELLARKWQHIICWAIRLLWVNLPWISLSENCTKLERLHSTALLAWVRVSERCFASASWDRLALSQAFLFIMIKLLFGVILFANCVGAIIHLFGVCIVTQAYVCPVSFTCVWVPRLVHMVAVQVRSFFHVCNITQIICVP